MPEPHFGLAHSMGGAVALTGAAEGWLPFRRLVTVAPMLAIRMVRWPAWSRCSRAACTGSGSGAATSPSASRPRSRPSRSRATASRPIRPATIATRPPPASSARAPSAIRPSRGSPPPSGRCAPVETRHRPAHPHPLPDRRRGCRPRLQHAGHRALRRPPQDRPPHRPARCPPRDSDGMRRGASGFLGGFRRVRAGAGALGAGVGRAGAGPSPESGRARPKQMSGGSEQWCFDELFF